LDYGHFCFVGRVQLTNNNNMDGYQWWHRHTQWYLIMFFGRVPMGINCAPLLAECSCIGARQTLYSGFSGKKMKLARSFNFTFCCRWCPFTK
jgi:hypothetical protein